MSANKQQVNLWDLSNPGILHVSRRNIIQINTTFLWFMISCRQEKWHCSLLKKSFLCIVLVKCDFEDGLCGMEQRHWRIGSGLTPTKNTGPDYDHTTLGPEGWFESQVFQFSLRFPFWKGATKCLKLSHEQQAALSLYLKRKLKTL